jgi:hypothetical protein
MSAASNSSLLNGSSGPAGQCFIYPLLIATGGGVCIQTAFKAGHDFLLQIAVVGLRLALQNGVPMFRNMFERDARHT